MPYVIDATDAPGRSDLRASVRPEHLDYLAGVAHLVLAAGPKLSDDGERVVGSLLIVDVDTREAAQGFVDGDPYARNGVFSHVTLTRWRTGYFDGKPV